MCAYVFMRARGYTRDHPCALGLLPGLFVNAVRPSTESLVLLNQSIHELPLELSLTPVTEGKIKLLYTLNGAMEVQKDLGFTARDIDDVVRLFVETPTWVLFMVLFVSSAHLVLDILAVRNDIAFFSSVENMTGQSLSAQAFTVLSQTVVRHPHLRARFTCCFVLLPYTTRLRPADIDVLGE